MVRVISIYRDSVVDGPGLRTVIFFAGCGQQPKCPFCQNPDAWSPTSGKEIPMDKLIQYATQTKNNEITFSGGDPLTYQYNGALIAAKKLKQQYHKNIWVFTGYRYEDILKDSQLIQILPYIDVLVDGRFVYKLKDLSLQFRGSSNQRLIDVPKSLSSHKVVLWHEEA